MGSILSDALATLPIVSKKAQRSLQRSVAGETERFSTQGATVEQEDTLAPGKSREGSSSVGEGMAEDELVRRLVVRARTNDQLAFRQLVEIYQQRVYAVAFGVIGNPQDAEDIVQDAFVKAYKKLDTFKGQSSFYTWLYRITFNLSVDLSRKRYRHRELMFGDQRGIEIGVGMEGQNQAVQLLSDRYADPERALQRSQLRDSIRGALQELSAEHRAVITLREIDGLSYAEISEVVGVSKGTVMSRLHHARRKLQRSLSQFLSVSSDSSERTKPSAATGSTVKI